MTENPNSTNLNDKKELLSHLIKNPGFLALKKTVENKLLQKAQFIHRKKTYVYVQKRESKCSPTSWKEKIQFKKKHIFLTHRS